MKSAGVKNGPAKAAIIISIVLIVVGIIVAIVISTTLFAACSGLEPGTYTLENGGTLTCG